jgi:hypothetical protein
MMTIFAARARAAPLTSTYALELKVRAHVLPRRSQSPFSVHGGTALQIQRAFQYCSAMRTLAKLRNLEKFEQLFITRVAQWQSISLMS